MATWPTSARCRCGDRCRAGRRRLFDRSVRDGRLRNALVRHPHPRIGRRGPVRGAARAPGHPALPYHRGARGCSASAAARGWSRAATTSRSPAGDSLERHFIDTIEGGKWLPDQDLAWTLVDDARERVRELENELGCFFDRNPDGTLHQKAFAGQTFDRTVHKGDLTGIEIINRLTEQVWARGIGRLEEHRAVDLDPDAATATRSPACCCRHAHGRVRVRAARRRCCSPPAAGRRCTSITRRPATRPCDGLAMALRAGLALRDMEMVQFHPTGLLAGTGTRMTGTVLEEGLRGAGGYLLNGDGERFMLNYDPTRRARDARHRLARDLRRDARRAHDAQRRRLHQHGPSRPGERAQAVQGHGRALRGLRLRPRRRPVEVVPTAHYLMGGVDVPTSTTRRRLRALVAGEDAGGVHGANRLGGNGVANSTVFGGIAGDLMPRRIEGRPSTPIQSTERIAAEIDRATRPFSCEAGRPRPLRERLLDGMWDDAGIIRDAEGLGRAKSWSESMAGELERTGVAGCRSRIQSVLVRLAQSRQPDPDVSRDNYWRR